MERYELTEPFAALLDEDGITMKTAIATNDTVTTSQTTPDAPAVPEVTEDITDRCRPSSVFRAMDANQDVVTDSTETNTHRALVRTVRGLNKFYVVGRLGLEPRTYGIRTVVRPGSTVYDCAAAERFSLRHDSTVFEGVSGPKVDP